MKENLAVHLFKTNINNIRNLILLSLSNQIILLVCIILSILGVFSTSFIINFVLIGLVILMNRFIHNFLRGKIVHKLKQYMNSDYFNPMNFKQDNFLKQILSIK